MRSELLKYAIFTIAILNVVHCDENQCSKSKCGYCVKKEDVFSCDECIDSVSKVVGKTKILNQDIYGCEGSSSGVDNCLVKYRDNELPYVGCKICKSEYFQDYEQEIDPDDKKVRFCTAGSIINCQVYRQKQAGSGEYCLACKKGFIMTKERTCGTLGPTIKNCQMSNYEQVDDKYKCYGCEAGFGSSAADSHTTCQAGKTEGCIFDQMNQYGCTRCNIYALYFSEEETIQNLVYGQKCLLKQSVSPGLNANILFLGFMVIFGFVVGVL